MIAKVPDRQPAFLEPDQYDWWVTTDAPAEALTEIWTPLEPSNLTLEPASLRVNDPSVLAQ